MSMMRRGPLDRFPVEWVLRQAGTHRASGSIELHTDHPATLYLDGGQVGHAVMGLVDPDQPGSVGPTAASQADEGAARRAVVAVIADALAGESGFYYHDPLGRTDEPARWRWDPSVLLAEARTSVQERRSLGRWTHADVVLRGGIGPLAVGPDAWAVIVSLAATAGAGEVLGRLGWPADRLVSALDELAERGALAAADPSAVPVVGTGPRTAEDGPGTRLRPPATLAAGRAATTTFRPPPPDAAAAVAAAEEVLARADVSRADWPRPALVPARPVPPLAAVPDERSPRPTVRSASGSAPGAAPVTVLDERRGALRRLISSLRPA